MLAQSGVSAIQGVGRNDRDFIRALEGGCQRRWIVELACADIDTLGGLFAQL